MNYNKIMLINPKTKSTIDLKDYNQFYDKVYDLYIDDDHELTNIQSDFYSDIKFPNYNKINDLGTLIEITNSNLFIKKLDDEIGFNKKILEIGCGTGQLSLSLSRFQRKITAIDLSKGSLIEAKKFADRNNIGSVTFYRMNVFNLFFMKNSFDFVISNGVLHHTHNCRLAFTKAVEVLKVNGYIVVGLYHKYGRIIQKIRQSLYPILKKNLMKLDRRFKEEISEEKKYAWFKDQYNNPHESTHTYSELIKWFDEENIEYICSIPFDFDIEKKLLQKKDRLSKAESFVSDLSLAFNKNQIYEGGFFVMIGKKIK